MGEFDRFIHFNLHLPKNDSLSNTPMTPIDLIEIVKQVWIR